MTERDAQAILDAIRTPEAKRAMDPAFRERMGLRPADARPRVTVGRTRYELTANGRVWTWTAVGKSGLRWKLEPYDEDPAAHWHKDVRAWAHVEVKPVSRPTE